jgi:hypothetical protein
MPRTALPIIDVPVNAEIDSITFSTADQTNGNAYPNDGKTHLIFQNTTGAAITATIVSVADEAGRTGDLTVVVPATTGIGYVPRLRQPWWNQQSGVDAGSVLINYSAAGLKVAALRHAQ